jgi:hypothetical protein
LYFEVDIEKGTIKSEQKVNISYRSNFYASFLNDGRLGVLSGNVMYQYCTYTRVVTPKYTNMRYITDYYYFYPDGSVFDSSYRFVILQKLTTRLYKTNVSGDWFALFYVDAGRCHFMRYEKSEGVEEAVKQDSEVDYIVMYRTVIPVTKGQLYRPK